MKSLIALLFTLVMYYGTAQQAFPYSAQLLDQDGNEVNANSISNDGKPLIIDFWGSFCKPCIVKYNAMMEIYEEWQKETGVKIVIVSIDYEPMMNMSKKLIEKYNWPFEAYFDPNQELMNQLADGNSVPRTFVFNGNYDLVYKHTGASIIKKNESDERSVGEIMYDGGSLTSLSCDLSDYIKAVKKSL